MDTSPPLGYDELVNLKELISTKTKYRPKIAIICGSGLGGLSETVQHADVIKYNDLPGFPISTVAGHQGELVFGLLEEKHVVLMKGRCHMYEGYPAWKVTVPIRVFFLLGVKILIVTNAAGGLNKSFNVGDLMIIKDHISLPCLAGYNPLIGPNDERFGPRFPATSNAYSKSLRGLVQAISKEQGMNFVKEGIYCNLSGPTYESIAEVRFIQSLGCDAVGMSTVPEVIVARHCGLEVFGMSLITNIVVTDYESNETANHEEVLETGRRRAKDTATLISKLIRQISL